MANKWKQWGIVELVPGEILKKSLRDSELRNNRHGRSDQPRRYDPSSSNSPSVRHGSQWWRVGYKGTSCSDIQAVSGEKALESPAGDSNQSILKQSKYS